MHLATHDVVILTGGVSMGRFDHVPQTLRDLGVQAGPAPGRAATGPAALVRRRPERAARVRSAGQPGVLAGLPRALRRAGARGRHGARATATQTAELAAAHSLKPALWFFLPVRLDATSTPG